MFLNCNEWWNIDKLHLFNGIVVPSDYYGSFFNLGKCCDARTHKSLQYIDMTCTQLSDNFLADSA
ncbi:unnamed protein product, partial [Allacma fusca]